MTNKKAQLIALEWPTFGTATPPPRPALSEFAGRIEAARRGMQHQGLTHLVVYGDREHFANLTYLTGFDPRFEEALLILGTTGTPLLVVGNECAGYLDVSPLYGAGQLRGERFQPFSLLGQPRGQSRLIKEIFASEGIGANAQVGCVGWKYFADAEHPDSAHAIDLPAYLVDTLRALAGNANVVNATGLLMNPRDGLRTRCSAAEIAYFEYTNILASEGIKRMLFGLREGLTDYEVVQLAQVNGEPLSCHPTFASGSRRDLGLSSPSGETIRRGEPLSFNLAYWGSNSCRAGWIAATATDLPAAAQGYVEAYAGPYFAAVSEWYNRLRIGTPGGELAQLIDERLPFADYGIFLNPGHLIHLDEWVSSPIYAGSTDPIQSGMVFQVDIIPSSPIYGSTRAEDGVVVTDAGLRQALATGYPDCFARCQQRRNFMIEVLGIDLPEELLPLSNIPAIVPPFFLQPNQVFAMR